MGLRSALLFNALVFALWAQPTAVSARDAGGVCLRLSPGIQLTGMRDHGFSPLLYSGTGAVVSLAWELGREQRSSHVEAYFGSAGLFNGFGTRVDVLSAGILAFRFYHADRDPGQGLHWGWANNNELMVRDNEAMTNFNHRFHYFTSFGPALRYVRPFELFGRSFSFRTLAHFQLLGFRLQSSYVVSGPRGYEYGNGNGLAVFWDSIEWFIPPRSWNFSLYPSLQYILKSGNRLSVDYQYDFVLQEGAHRVSSSRGRWALGLIFRI
jgi:hypothetical protein